MNRLSILPRRVLRQWNVSEQYQSRPFNSSTRSLAIKPFLLADIGEGIRECEIIQWFVQPEARVEEFDKICEVQSDKASVDIPSRFSGVIKKLHYESGEMAQVGKPLVDIDVQEDIESEDPLIAKPTGIKESDIASNVPDGFMARNESSREGQGQALPYSRITRHAAVATPAVRHLTKELDVDITEVTGTGKDGRVTKDDVHKFASARDSEPSSASVPEYSRPAQPLPAPKLDGPQQETTIQLSNIQSQMFKTMTRSLTIPHFLYADEVDFSALSHLRQRVNKSLSKSNHPKLSYLPFIIKAMSLSMDRYPILNSRVEIADAKPSLVMRHQHNVGIAMDTPQGLLVPVIKNVGSRSITSIASELLRLQSLASSNKLTSSDLSGGTITLSNIGNIGGTYVSPIIVDKEVAILGVGKLRSIPAFNEAGTVSRGWCDDG
ncbi:MAG: hypothetical protein M1818_007538 [Claussenomyces sp. TS43310]|nr:MAG: hypothetical protein M1818_007538 [Claussenomyces sp. TS43310]